MNTHVYTLYTCKPTHINTCVHIHTCSLSQVYRVHKGAVGLDVVAFVMLPGEKWRKGLVGLHGNTLSHKTKQNIKLRSYRVGGVKAHLSSAPVLGMCRCTEPGQALGLPDPFAQANLLFLEMEPRTLPHTLDKGSTKPTLNHGVGGCNTARLFAAVVMSYDHRLSLFSDPKQLMLSLPNAS